MSHAGRSAPGGLQEFVRQHLGPFQVRSDLSWDHGESAVWHVTSEAGDAVLKAQRQERKFRQELNVYRSWLPRLALPEGVQVPQLLAWQDEPLPALLLSLERGEPVQEVGLSARAELSVHERAGEFLARLHALPIAADDPLTLDEAFRMRVEAWSARADGLLPERVIRNAVALAHEALPALAVMTRVACHRDFTPRNWLIDEAGTLTVIDFEHSRPDLHLVDFERLFTGLWRSRPELREAFLSGYGTDLSGDRTVVLRGVAALGGLSTVVWAREHGDARFEEHGRDVLSWLGLS